MNVSKVSLHQFVDLYLRLCHNDGVDSPEPLYLILSTKLTVAAEVDELLAAANEGKGSSEAFAWDEYEYDAEETAKDSGENQEQYGEQFDDQADVEQDQVAEEEEVADESKEAHDVQGEHDEPEPQPEDNEDSLEATDEVEEQIHVGDVPEDLDAEPENYAENGVNGEELSGEVLPQDEPSAEQEKQEYTAWAGSGAEDNAEGHDAAEVQENDENAQHANLESGSAAPLDFFEGPAQGPEPNNETDKEQEQQFEEGQVVEETFEYHEYEQNDQEEDEETVQAESFEDGSHAIDSQGDHDDVRVTESAKVGDAEPSLPQSPQAKGSEGAVKRSREPDEEGELDEASHPDFKRSRS